MIGPRAGGRADGWLAGQHDLGHGLTVPDSGLACHLLGIDSPAELAKSPFAGSLFEGFIASEILKAQVNAGGRRELYHFRDEQGLEVDFVTPGRSGSLTSVECQAVRTVTPAMAGSMQRLRDAVRKQRPKDTGVNVPCSPGTEGEEPGRRRWRRESGRWHGAISSRSCDRGRLRPPPDPATTLHARFRAFALWCIKVHYRPGGE